MNAFLAYSWPGNVRALEKVVERALIMTTGTPLAAEPLLVATLSGAPAANSSARVRDSASTPPESLADVERAHIRGVLDQCGRKITGKGNAADRLGLPRSTLLYRMKKLSIEPPAARHRPGNPRRSSSSL